MVRGGSGTRRKSWGKRHNFTIGVDGAIRRASTGESRYRRFGDDQPKHQIRPDHWVPNAGPTESEVDRNAIMDSMAFRRLMGVTQVVSPDLDSPYLNTRYSHSLKVGELSRFIAERLIRNADIDGNDSRDIAKMSARDCIKKFGGIDPVACEAAGLAHDLGHPPFGHIGEQVLDESLRHYGVKDGFEGNAQTFRILTVLEGQVSREGDSLGDNRGLGLSALVRCAVLKYPWTRLAAPEQAQRQNFVKFCVYESEYDVFADARSGISLPPPDQTQSLEASIMDVADDIAYSFHDLEDFIRIGVIDNTVLSALDAWHDAINRDHNRNRFIRDVDNFRDLLSGFSEADTDEQKQEAEKRLNNFTTDIVESSNAFTRAAFRLARSPYFDATRWLRAIDGIEDNFRWLLKAPTVSVLRSLIALKQQEVIDNIIYHDGGVWSGGPWVSLAQDEWHDVEAYKLVTQDFVHASPRVSLVQQAQRQSIQSLFDGLVQWCVDGPQVNQLPTRLKEILQGAGIGRRTPKIEVPEDRSISAEPLEIESEQYRTLRGISDYICSLTDYECHQRSAWLRGLEVPGISRVLP